MRQITFDIETRNIFQDVGSNDPKDLDISVVCIHDSATNECYSYFQEDLPKLWPILEQADLLITFNGNHFDIPLLNKYYTGNLSNIKSLDLMAEVKSALGRRIKLDTLAEATLGRKKSGHGLEAITWWKNKEFDKLIHYCTEDVKITRQLYDFAIKNGHLRFTDGLIVREIKLNTKDWEKKIETAMNYTLPF